MSQHEHVSHTKAFLNQHDECRCLDLISSPLLITNSSRHRHWLRLRLLYLLLFLFLFLFLFLLVIFWQRKRITLHSFMLTFADTPHRPRPAAAARPRAAATTAPRSASTPSAVAAAARTNLQHLGWVEGVFECGAEDGPLRLRGGGGESTAAAAGATVKGRPCAAARPTAAAPRAAARSATCFGCGMSRRVLQRLVAVPGTACARTICVGAAAWLLHGQAGGRGRASKGAAM